METIWQFKTRNFRVTLAWDYEPHPDLSWADQETLDNLESGHWVNCLFRVAVYGPNGEELGTSYLGESIHESPSDFRDHLGINEKSRADNCNYGSYFTDMVSEAIAETRKAMRAAQSVYIRAA